MCAASHMHTPMRGPHKISDGRELQFVLHPRASLHVETLFARESRKFGSRDRSGYIETLYLMAPDRSQNLQLCCGFHAFRDESQIQGVTHADDGG